MGGDIKTQKEIKSELKATERELQETQAIFAEYDNIEDMEHIEQLHMRIDTLLWVLD